MDTLKVDPQKILALLSSNCLLLFSLTKAHSISRTAFIVISQSVPLVWLVQYCVSFFGGITVTICCSC